MLERLWLPQTSKGLMIYVLDELGDARMKLLVLRCPPVEILKGLRQEGDSPRLASIETW
jgi:hypothetical protein